MTSYLEYLTTRVPPRRLLGGAARKALRHARLTFGRPLPPSGGELLAGLRVTTPGELALRLATPARGLVALDGSGAGAALERFFPGEAANAVERAEHVLAGRLVVFGHSLDVRSPRGGTDWHRDFLNGGAFPAFAPAELLPHVPAADPKVPWAVGRGEQWVALGCAAKVDPARRERYASAFVAGLRDFVEHNPLGRGVQWASPMEAALRVVCLGQAHALLTDSPALRGGQYALDLAHLAVASARIVLARLEDAQVVPNNHLVADWVGLLACAALLPEWPEASRWRALAAAGLARELQRQTHEDGTTFEGSLPYHRLSVELFTAGALLARRVGAPLGGAYWRRLSTLYTATRDLLFAGGSLPQIGDDDAGRVLAFRERRALDGGYLLPLGAALTGAPALRCRPGVEDGQEALWLLGPVALGRLAATRPGRAPVSRSFPRGGFHLLRRAPMEVAVSCGRNGQDGVGGHSHNDKLAFELAIGGRLVVCDPGSPCYTSDPERRDRFRSTRAHATVVVDGAEQAPIPAGRLFALPDAARATVLAFESTARHERFVGEHRGYARLGLVHRRELLLFDDALVVADRLEGAGVHRLELRYPLPDERARVRPLDALERARLAALGLAPGTPFDAARAVELGAADAPAAVLVVASPVPLELRLEEASYSPGYGEARPARTPVFFATVPGPATLVTVILPCASRPVQPYPVETA